MKYMITPASKGQATGYAQEMTAEEFKAFIEMVVADSTFNREFHVLKVGRR